MSPARPEQAYAHAGCDVTLVIRAPLRRVGGLRVREPVRTILAPRRAHELPKPLAVTPA